MSNKHLEKEAVLNEIKLNLFDFQPHGHNCTICYLEEVQNPEDHVEAQNPEDHVEDHVVEQIEAQDEEEHGVSSDESDGSITNPITPSKYSAIQDPKTPRRSQNPQEDHRSHHKKPLQKGQFIKKLAGKKETKMIVTASQNDFHINYFCDQEIAELYKCTYCKKVCVSPVYSSCGHMYCQVEI